MPVNKIALGKLIPELCGEYDRSKSYQVRDRVSYNGYVFECISTAPAGTIPKTTGSAFWLAVSPNAKSPEIKWDGSKLYFEDELGNKSDAVDLIGPKGDKGDIGDTGEAGVSPPLTSDLTSTAEDIALSALGANRIFELAQTKGDSVYAVTSPILSIGNLTTKLVQTRFTALATPILNGDRRVANFYLSVPELGIKEQIYEAVDNSATMEFQVPQEMEIGRQLNVTVKAVDDLGNPSPERTVIVTITDICIEQAIIVSPTQNEENVSLTPVIKLAPFSVVGDLVDEAKYVRVQIATDDGFGSLVWDSGDLSPSETVQVSEKLDRKTDYYVRAQWVGETYGTGPWSGPLKFKTADIILATPKITSPVEGQSVSKATGNLSLISSEFAVEQGEDEHGSTSWIISSDADRKDIVLEARESPDLISHSFDISGLVAGNNYYASCQHGGVSGIKSEWASLVMFGCVSYLTAPSGRSYYRHPSNMGSVMIYTEGTEKRVLVLDAAYRHNRNFGLIGNDSSLPNVSGSNISVSENATDAWINANGIKDPRTSKYNCNVLSGYSSYSSNGITGVPAVSYCRSIAVQGQACDLPNVQIATRIYCDRNFIDTLDNTIVANPTLALGTANTAGDWSVRHPNNTASNTFYGYTWTSSESSSSGAWRIYSGYVDPGASCKGHGYAVLPVLELAA